jgi:restriction system protein
MNKSSDRKTWVMRAGKVSEAQSLFLKSGVMALNEPGLGNLKALSSDRHAFYEAYRKCDPTNTRAGISGIGGKYFRFVYEVTKGDMVLLPSRLDHQVYIGYVTGDYFYAPKVDKRFPHQRNVKWKSSFDKSALSVWAKRELNAARTFFEYKRNVEEILELINKGQMKKISMT